MRHSLERNDSLAPKSSVEIWKRMRLLERELYVYRLSFLSVFVLFVIVFASGVSGSTKAPAEVRATRFTIVDDSGSVRAYFGHSGTSTALQMGADGRGIRMEHGANTNAIQLITSAHVEKEVEGFQTNSLTLHNDPYNTGLMIINPGTREDSNSQGRVWLNTLRGCELRRKMFD